MFVIVIDLKHVTIKKYTCQFVKPAEHVKGGGGKGV